MNDAHNGRLIQTERGLTQIKKGNSSYISLK